MPSCMSLNMAANGEDCRQDLAIGTPSTPRMNRWSKNGVLDQVFEYLQREQIVRIKLEAVSMDSTIVKVHPDGTGALKKTVPNPSAAPEGDGQPRFIWLPRMLEPPSRFHSRQDRPTMARKGASC